MRAETFPFLSYPSLFRLCNMKQASKDLCFMLTPFELDVSGAEKYAPLLLQAPLSEYFCSPHIHWQHWVGMLKDLDSLDKLDCLWDSEDRDFQAPCTFSKWDQSVELDFAEAFGDRELVQITARTGLLHWLFDHHKYASHLLALGLTADNAYVQLPVSSDPGIAEAATWRCAGNAECQHCNRHPDQVCCLLPL